MILTYDAIDRSGRQITDTINASSKHEAIEGLRRSGMLVTHIAPASDAEIKKTTQRGITEASAMRMSLKNLVLFTRQISMLLRSGSAVVPALSAISRHMNNPGDIELLRTIRRDLEEGCTLTEALRKHPKTFDSAYCAVIAAGEASATLPDMFQRLARIYALRRATRNQVVGAAIYPALLVVLCVSVVNTLLFFVMPRFAVMFDTLSVPLPSSTEFMLALSALLRTYWPGVVAAVAALIALVVFTLTSTAGRQWIANVQIRPPIVGTLMSRLIQAEVFRLMGMLLNAKVSVLETLDLVRGTTANNRFQALFDQLEGAVTSGKSVSSAMESSRLIDPTICQAVRTGEESGNLGGAVSFAAEVLDEDNTQLVHSVTKLAEPLILIVMGLMVGVLAVSLFMPLFDMTSAIH